MRQEFTLTLDGIAYKVAAAGDTILVDGQPFRVSFDSANKDKVIVEGVPYEVVLEGHRAIVGSIAHNLEVEGLAVAPTIPTIRPGAAPAPPKVAAGEGAVTAIMPGKVIRILVREGDKVAEGDVVLILEAMKMENELNAPRAGTVKAIHVAPGSDVEMGAVLVEIEPARS